MMGGGVEGQRGGWYQKTGEPFKGCLNTSGFPDSVQEWYIGMNVRSMSFLDQ